MEQLISQWRKELEEAGKIKPGEDISNQELVEMYQTFKIEMMQSQLGGSFASLTEDGLAIKRPEGLREVEPGSSDAAIKVDIRTGMKRALNALLTVAKGANYCMFVIDRAWINFRFRNSKNNLHLQVAGNKYIQPMEISHADIANLEEMGILPEEGSVEIWCKDFDDEPRDLDCIVDTIRDIFNKVYHIDDGTSAYIELDLANGEDESVRNEIAQIFKKRDGKKFKFYWKRSF